MDARLRASEAARAAEEAMRRAAMERAYREEAEKIIAEKPPAKLIRPQQAPIFISEGTTVITGGLPTPPIPPPFNIVPPFSPPFKIDTGGGPIPPILPPIIEIGGPPTPPIPPPPIEIPPRSQHGKTSRPILR